MKAPNVKIQSTEKTPSINFDFGVIEIKGRSILEDSTAFYKPLVEWIDNYSKKPAEFTNVIFQVEYSNSNSNKYFFQIINILEKSYLLGNKMKLEWRFESDDDAIKDLGNDLKALSKLPFEMVEIG